MRDIIQVKNLKDKEEVHVKKYNIIIYDRGERLEKMDT